MAFRMLRFRLDLEEDWQVSNSMLRNFTQLSVHQHDRHDRVTCLCLSFYIQRCLCGHLSLPTFLLTHHFQTLLLTDTTLFSLGELWAVDILMSLFHPCEAVYLPVYSLKSTLARWIFPDMHIVDFREGSSIPAFGGGWHFIIWTNRDFWDLRPIWHLSTFSPRCMILPDFCYCLVFSKLPISNWSMIIWPFKLPWLKSASLSSPRYS